MEWSRPVKKILFVILPFLIDCQIGKPKTDATQGYKNVVCEKK